MSGAAGKPKWLILGGLGFIGRNLCKYLVDNGLASYIRVADKKAPFMAFLSGDYKAAILESGIVESIQVDVADEEMCEKAFAEARGGGGFDYVVNLAAETALGKPDSFYAKTVDGATLAGNFALRTGVKRFIHVSSASVYKPAASAAGTAEDGKLAPWTAVADAMLRSEAALQAIKELPLIILRPAMVYGPGDFASLMPRCVVAASYKRMGERMEMLWDGDMKMSTVHVFDVARSIYWAAKKAAPGAVFNLADKGDTDQGKITGMLGSIFGIDTGFYGSIKSNMAALRLDTVVDTANETHLGPWLALLKEHSIRNTPLSPYLHKQLLSHNHLCINGSAIEAAGFKYAIAAPTQALLLDPILQHIAQGIFPPILDAAAASAAAAATGGAGK